MEKGFTLMELLVTVIIIGLIATIAGTIVINAIESSKTNLYETQKRQIIKGAKDYYVEHLNELPEVGTSVTIKLTKLQELGYLPEDVINPKTRRSFDSTALVRVTNNNSYSYEFIE